MARTALIIATALLAGCAGGLPTGPCAGVVCAPGRVCIEGTCQFPAAKDDDPWAQDPDAGAFGSDVLLHDLLSPDAFVADTLPPTPDMDTGRWYQVDKANCPTYCAGLGKSNEQSVDGGRCMSGEARPKSAIDQGLTFTYGCSSACFAQSGITTTSYGKYCYRPGQKQDDDDTDYTVGCFCR